MPSTLEPFALETPISGSDFIHILGLRRWHDGMTALSDFETIIRLNMATESNPTLRCSSVVDRTMDALIE